MELCFVYEGEMKLFIGNKQYHLKKGEGYFANSNILHMIKPVIGEKSNKTIGIVYLPQFIATENTLIYKKYIKPLVNNPQLRFFILQNDCAWHMKISNKVQNMYTLLKTNPLGIEIKARNLISDIWLDIYLHLNEIPTDEITNMHDAYELRLKKMCLYIQENYMTNINLTSIANSASISKSEAIRCFNNILSSTPYAYLLDYRIMIAKSLLVNTDESILNIAIKCGFNNSSYFSKLFKKITGKTPKEHRLQF